MAFGYTDTPDNVTEIISDVITDRKKITAEILGKQKCFFYDTCSFRRHAKLDSVESGYLLTYIKNQNGIIVITRCILMELASHSGRINREYVEYVKQIAKFGISVLLIYEEDLFSVMEAVFSTNAAINRYLCWAVRTIKSPISTITETLDQNSRINDEVIKGRNSDSGEVYKRFFSAVRNNKTDGDNLGEELLAICMYILSYIPGEKDGKFCVITDDKSAAIKIDTLFKRTPEQHKGKRITVFSTPKLVQVLHREHILEEGVNVKSLLSVGTDGNISVLCTRIYDIRAGIISFDSKELADLIVHPNGINIIF